MNNTFQQQVSSRIAKAMQDGNPPWRTTCRSDDNSGFPSNAKTKRVYNGINPLLLNNASQERGYQSKYWATYKQWAGLGCQVKSRPEDHNGDWGIKIMASGFKPVPVFNAEQVFGVRVKGFKISNERLLLEETADYDHAQNLIEATKAEITWDSDSPYYDRPPADRICLPPKDKFLNLRQLYATQFHELIHWCEWRTGWCGDDLLGELVAEIGTGYLEQRIGLPHCVDTTNYEKYCSQWLEQMQQDASYIFEAASQASKAVDFIFSFRRSSVRAC